MFPASHRQSLKVRPFAVPNQTSASPFSVKRTSVVPVAGARSKAETFAVLRSLVKNAGQLVTTEQLLAAVWPDLHQRSGVEGDIVS